MAERAGGKKRTSRKGKKRANGEANGLGHNSGEIPNEVYQRHYDQIGVADREVKRLADQLKKKRSALSNAYKAAKSDGIDPDDMRLAREVNEGDQHVVVLRYRNVGRILEAVESPLPLFRNIILPPPVNAYLAGQQAGREGAPADNNPHTPGTEEFVRWAEGHASGIDAAVEGLRTGQPTA